jgi:NOL1/NOP2/fmu family ribosome biogenesis protein
MILDQAAAMLAPGGRLVYSTCTFAPIENEGSISRFLTRHPEFSILPAARCDGMQPAVPAWGDGNEDLAQTIRLWPHKLHGEGHYLAVLKKEGMFPETTSDVPSGRAVRCVEWEAFQKEELRQTVLPQRELLFFGDQLYLAPPMMPSLKGLKVLRPGLHLGTVKKNRFEPAHALALALTAEDVVRAVELSAVSPDAACRYVGGETLRVDEGSEPAQNGWCLVTVDGYSIGWGKKTGGMIKNHYPKGLRKRL